MSLRARLGWGLAGLHNILRERLDAVETTAEELDEQINNEETGLVPRVLDLESDVSTINAWAARVKGQATTPPQSGTYNVGDIILNSAPTAGGYIGWVYLGSETGWRGFGEIAAS